MKKFLLPLLLVLAGLCSATPVPFVITENGKPAASIYVSPQASGAEKLAAEELKTYVRKISGADLPVVSVPGERCIIPVTVKSPLLPAALRKKLESARHGESFLISGNDGKKLYLAGKIPVGTLFAAYTLLEEVFHTAWFFPGEKFEYVEKNPTMKVPAMDRLYEPAFDYRLLSALPFARTMDAFIWAPRNRLQMPGPYAVQFTYGPKVRSFFEARLRDGVVTDGGHITFYLAAPPQKYRKSHPEYFALVDGKRSDKVTHADTHHCISNPELQKLVADYIVNLHKKYGGKVAYIFGAPDAARGWCECENCRKLDGGTGDHSRRFHTVVKKISDMVYARCPDMQFRLWAYWTYRNIPAGLSVDPRMTVYFCSHGRSHAQPLYDKSCAANVHMLKLMRDWLKLNPKMYLYDYPNATFSGYAPIFVPLAQDLKFYRKMGLLGVKLEYHLADGKYPAKQDPWRGGSLYSRTMWDYYYLFSKLVWDPDLDPIAVLNEAYRKYYGPAAAPIMIRYQAERRQLWDSTEGNYGWPEGDNRTPKVLQNPAGRTRLLALLAEAEKAAAKDPVALERIRFDRSCLQELWIAKAESYRKAAARTFFAPRLAEKVKLDGNAADGVWSRASFVSDFLNWETQKTLPAALNTTAAVFCDDQALYIAVTAMEPAMAKLKAGTLKNDDSGIFKDDGIEIFLAPPNEANRYYQFCINTRGAVWDGEQPGARSSWNSGIQAVCRRFEDRYVIEARIPFAKMEGKFKLNDRCPILIARNRRVRDGLGAGGFSLGGSPFHSTIGYRMMILGKPLIQNGTFVEADPKNPKLLKGWTLRSGKVVREGNRVSVQLDPKGVLSQHLWDWKGPLGQSPKPRHITVIFTGSGKGQAVIYLSRYTDTYVSAKLKRKYHGCEKLQVFRMTEKPQDFQFDYTIPADQWASLGISAPEGNVKIERVSILLK